VSEPLPFPSVERVVTLIAISKSEPVVVQAKILVSKRHLLAAVVEGQDDSFFERLNDAPATVLYEEQELSLVLRGRISGRVRPDRLLISLSSEPKVGERREFIRADITLGVRVEALPAHVATEEAALEWVASFPSDPKLFSFLDTPVDLSGSGARFSATLLLKKGELAAVTLRLPPGQEPTMVHMLARIVRGRPAKGHEGLAELAVEFLNMPEKVRDRLHHLVFQARARVLGVADLTAVDD
jgi:hypothetical protein